MSNTKTLHFCDINGETIELVGNECPMEKKDFRLKFPGVRGVSYDSFSFVVMAHPVSGEKLPLTRRINYKCKPSLHVCNARCMGGKCGGTCECRCGGRNHGLHRAA